MLDREEFDRWRASAGDALAGARAQVDEELHQWACFLAEQAGQLAVKALLHGVGGESRGHDLVDLGDRLQEALGVAPPPDVRAALRRLSRLYIPTRYPDAHPGGTPGSHYGREDSQQALDDAEWVLSYVDAAWRRLDEEVGGGG